MKIDYLLKGMQAHTYTQEEKEEVWGHRTMSGSKFKKWCLEADRFDTPTIIPDAIMEKVKFGNTIEHFIRDVAFKKLKVSHWDEDVNTKTHHIEKTDYYANIDGLFMMDEDKYILEIKNTEIDDINALVEQYKYQTLYYSWYFKIPNVVLAVLIKGWKLRTALIAFSPKDWEFAEKQISNFDNYDAAAAKELVWERKFVENTIIDNVGEAELLNWYSDNWDKIKDCEALIKNLQDRYDDGTKKVIPFENFNLSYASPSTTKKLNIEELGKVIDLTPYYIEIPRKGSRRCIHLKEK